MTGKLILLSVNTWKKKIPTKTEHLSQRNPQTQNTSVYNPTPSKTCFPTLNNHIYLSKVEDKINLKRCKKHKGLLYLFLHLLALDDLFILLCVAF